MRAVKNGEVEENEIADHCWPNRMDWDNKSIVDREKLMTTRNIKETIRSLK